MAIPMVAQSSLPTSSAGIQVIVCEPDARTCAELRSFIDADSMLTLAAETRSWQECQVVIEDLGPELLIVRSELIPADWAAKSGHDSFLPVVIELQHASGTIMAAPYGNVLIMPAAPEVVRRLLNRAVTDIYDRKARQLWHFVDRYIAASKGEPEYRSTISVEHEGRTIELDADEILSIVAARKCVYVYTHNGQYLLREALHFLSMRLDPKVFIRIHRSIIINIHHVDRTVPMSARSSYISLTDGSRHPVGPNYRDVLAQIKDTARLDSPSLYRRIS